jgi:hypothetical protein
MPKWEYKNLKYEPERSFWGGIKNEDEYIHELNKLGSDGWELVDILHYTNGLLRSVVFILKRQVNE